MVHNFRDANTDQYTTEGVFGGDMGTAAPTGGIARSKKWGGEEMEPSDRRCGQVSSQKSVLFESVCFVIF